jgi:Spy/CpxP family protein refolding chaperone
MTFTRRVRLLAAAAALALAAPLLERPAGAQGNRETAPAARRSAPRAAQSEGAPRLGPRRRAARQRPAVNRWAAIGRALRALNLTPEQRRNVLAVRDRNDGRLRALGRRTLDGRRRVEESLYGATPDVDSARAAARDLSAAAAERARVRTRIEAEVLQVLTPEQRGRLRAVRAERRSARSAGPPADALPAEPERGEENELVEPEAAPARRGAARAFAALGLGQDQRAQLRALRRRLMPVVRDLNHRHREAQAAVDDALLQEAMEMPRIEELAAELGRIESERVMRRFEVEAGVRSILTAEQAARFLAGRRAARRPAARERAQEEPADEEPAAPELDSP